MDDFDELQKSLNYEFEDKKLLIQSLTHKSSKGKKNNERLEFLGDAVLDLVVGEYLFEKFPTKSEGELSKYRASLVNEVSFAKFAKKLKLDNYIKLSRAEEKNNGREKLSILSDAFEALMGAIYLKSGIKKVKTILINLINQEYKELNLENISRDYKTTLQEVTQELFGSTPQYKVVSSSGPDHDKIFNVSITINNKVYTTQSGKSKKEAQQNCAKIAYKMIGKSNE